MDIHDLERAGMTDEDGRLLAPPWDFYDISLPAKVRLENDCLLWEPPRRPEDFRIVDHKGMVDSFVRLKNAQDVLGFAERFGPLYLCVHGLPASHNPGDARTPWEPGCALVGQTSGERIAVWLDLVKQAAAWLQIAGAIRAGNPVPESAWHDAGSWTTAPGHEQQEPDEWRRLKDPGDQWIALRTAVNHCLRLARSGLLLRGPLNEAKVVIAPAGTFGHLAVQLATAVAASVPPAICDGCQLPWTPPTRTRARAGRRNFCDVCRNSKIPARLQKRDQRARDERRSHEPSTQAS
jgi:hypothetical protein